jgi:DNA-binding transcriptional LysR family regulator
MMQDLNISLLRTFVSVVELGSFTGAGRRIGRTQPAVTHQIRRLEGLVGRTLVTTDKHRVRLTVDGEILLQYARTILSLNEEALARFSAPEVQGRVALGTPDLYAAYLLPDVLASFSRAYPGVEVELTCRRSIFLQEALERGELDIAIITRQPNSSEGEIVRREPLIWVASPEYRPETDKILPLALLPEGSVYRHHALDVLNGSHRSWRIVSVSDSLAGLEAAVFAGLAVAVFPQCARAQGMRQLGPAAGLPPLPALDLVLVQRPQIPDAAKQLAKYIALEIPSAAPSRLSTGGGKILGVRQRD